MHKVRLDAQDFSKKQGLDYCSDLKSVEIASLGSIIAFEVLSAL